MCSRYSLFRLIDEVTETQNTNWGSEMGEMIRKENNVYMQLLWKNILLSTNWLHKTSLIVAYHANWISSFFMHVNLNFPPGQWCIEHFRCWWIISGQEQASQKMMGPLLCKGSWFSQCVQNSEQGEDAVFSLAASKLRVAFILNHDFFSIHVLNLLVLLFVIAKELFSLSFCFKHFN